MEGRYGGRSVESKVGEVKDLGVIGHGVQHHRSMMLVPKGHQAKGHGVTGQNLKMKGQEFKGEISLMKEAWIGPKY